MTIGTESPEVRAFEDAAWDLKEAAADLFSRKLDERDVAVLASVQRDLVRIKERLVGMVRRRRRGNGAEASQQEEPAEP
jgi:hypothetical protein